MRSTSFGLFVVLLLVLGLVCCGGEEKSSSPVSDTTAKKPDPEETKEKAGEDKMEKQPAESSKGGMSHHPVVVMKTTLGDIKIELDRKRAPITVDNFLQYAKSSFYDGLIFHRVMSTFMIQAGGYTMELYDNPMMRSKTTRDPIKNEAKEGLSNKRGTIAMARTPAPHSASSQFFINVVDNQKLDYRNENNYGYAVFGKVIAGMDVVDAIRDVPVKRKGNHQNLPAEPVQIQTVEIISE
ncbi:MAG: peptidylprolyl isomerase [Planctomycetota bacterium]|jgi:cyclophilin family peptidyl-prolyl cis-trans isomerase